MKNNKIGITECEASERDCLGDCCFYASCMNEFDQNEWDYCTCRDCAIYQEGMGKE